MNTALDDFIFCLVSGVLYGLSGFAIGMFKMSKLRVLKHTQKTGLRRLHLCSLAWGVDLWPEQMAYDMCTSIYIEEIAS